MPIKSRFIKNGNATAHYLMPPPIVFLFDKITPIGTVISRRILHKELTRIDERRRPVEDLWFWLYPAFTTYRYDPRHVIVTGHILLCDPDEDQELTLARSVRLFVDDPGYRSRQYAQLCHRVTRDAQKYLSGR